MANLADIVAHGKRVSNISAGLVKVVSGIEELEQVEADKIDAILSTVRQSLGEAVKLAGEAAAIDLT